MSSEDTEVTIEKSIYLDCYQHLLDDNDIDIELIWGGRDSGKSKFVAQFMTEAAMAREYLRCLLIKETHRSIQGAQWQMMKDVTEQWEVDHLFKFLTSPLGIRVPINGNSLEARGLDDPTKLKSFSNPSDAWLEEADQITEDSFIILLTSLRSDYGKVKLWMTFNPESKTQDFTDFWIYKMFFAKYKDVMYDKTFTGIITTEIIARGVKKIVSLKFRSTWTTYQDNPYVSDQRMGVHEFYRQSNPYYYNVYTLGHWGNKINDSPWAYAYSAAKHRGTPEPDRNYPLYCSFDFNRNPACVSIIQLINGQVRVLETVKIHNAGTDALCDYILMYYPGFMYIVTGDYSGHTPSSVYKEQVTNYKIIRQKLKLTDAMLQVRTNPRLEKNQTLVNSILQHGDVVIHETKAKFMIFDMENVKKRADGTIVKNDRDDEAQQADALDTFRYFCNAFMSNFKPPMFQEPSKDIKVLSASKVINHIKGGSIQQLIDQPATNLLMDVLQAIKQGKNASCTKYEYYISVRETIIEAAGFWINEGDIEIAEFAMSEIRRLDLMFSYDES